MQENTRLLFDLSKLKIEAIVVVDDARTADPREIRKFLNEHKKGASNETKNRDN